MKPVAFTRNNIYLFAQYCLKRCFDVLFSLLILLVLSPLLALVALLVSLDRGPVFFIQPRIGKNGKLFPCYKFRSMCVGAEESLPRYLRDPAAKAQWDEFQKLADDERITKFGKLIRTTSIDELPQLLNVIRGEMSLVGPRPILPQQRWSYGRNMIHYARVRPGITGPWQVSGRNRISFSERIALECNYVRNWNLFADAVILLKTIPAVLKGDNAIRQDGKICPEMKSA